MAGRLELFIVFWKAWGVKAVVMLSFALQVTLLLTASIRRYKGSLMLKAIIWLAYVLADTTAVYALGHMSVMVTSPEHQLMALWAPLLLVHLGGQDNITAYAIEDNRLWMRHLQIFSVQVVAAAYVIYESSILGRNTLLCPTTILMFLDGILKYGERVWAMVYANNCASSSLSATNYKDFRQEDLESQRRRDIHYKDKDDQDLQFEAYMMLDIPKQMFEGPTRYVKEINNAYGWDPKETSKAVEMQLSMMYDLLYTKAAVVHTWYGWCIRIFSLLATIASLVMFHASSDKLHGGYNRVDVVVTYVLLAGAVVLEIISVLRTIFSTWTCVLLLARGCRRISRVLQFLPQLIRSVLHARYWSGSMGQLSLVTMSYRSRRNLSSKIARWMGRGDWWDSIWHSTSAYVSQTIMGIVVERVSLGTNSAKDNEHHIRNSRGLWALVEAGYGDLDWTVKLELDESILVWHIATEIYYVWWGKNKSSSMSDEMLKIKTMSRYMAFLLAAHPYMLPYPVSRQGYVQLCYDLLTHQRDDLLDALCRKVAATEFQPEISSLAEQGETRCNDTLNKGWKLALKLINMNRLSDDCGPTITMISSVWVEMLCYTAYGCNENYHAKHLSNGGEILTSISLLMIHMSGKSPWSLETLV